MIKASLAMMLCGLRYIFILVTNTATVGLLMLSLGTIAYGVSFVQSEAVPSMIARLGLATGFISATEILMEPASGLSALAVIAKVGRQ